MEEEKEEGDSTHDGDYAANALTARSRVGKDASVKKQKWPVRGEDNFVVVVVAIVIDAAYGCFSEESI